MRAHFSEQGSLWRRWDLHVHPPGTKLSDCYTADEDVWEKFLDLLERSPVQAFGITDYFCADGYFEFIEKYSEKFPDSEKIFFPNIEFRLVEAISRTNSNPHIHVIFDYDSDECSRGDIERFLNTLKTSSDRDAGVRLSCAELHSTAQYESATISLRDLTTALSDTFGESEPFLIAFPAKNDGVRSTDSQSPRKVAISDKLDKTSNLFFGDSDCADWFLRNDRYETGESDPKPVVSCSDAHSFDDLERLEGNVPGYEPTWIKADLTFRGLRQICFEPQARVHIGAEPAVEERKAAQGTKFLTSMRVDQNSGYDEANGRWFRNVNIDLNPELVAIIGNKGSGKSAVVDIIGLLGDSRQEDYFSFLTNKGTNKKFRQRGFSENFHAELTWHQGDPVSKGLDERVDLANPERVRYLPQSYFEQLTNEIEIAEFRREIEEVVFSHVDETERMKKDSFADLQEFKTLESKRETSALKSNLRELNIEIVELENQADPSFRKKLEGELKAKRNELDSLKKAEPPKEPKPEKETPEQKKISDEIARLTRVISELKKTEGDLIEKIATAKNQLQTLQALQNSLSLLESYVRSQKEELKVICDDLELDIDEIIKSSIDLTPVKKQIDIAEKKIEQLEKDNRPKFSADVKYEDLTSLPDTQSGLGHLGKEVTELKKRLAAPQRKYQKYLEKVAKWKDQIEEVVGDSDEPKAGTINYIEARIRYLDEALTPRLEKAKDDRVGLSKKIFESKQKILAFYSDLKTSVDEKLDAVRAPGFSVEIEASFVLDRKFNDQFLKLVNKSKRGSFHGSNEPEGILRRLLADVQWNDFDSVDGFIDSIMEALTTYDSEPNMVAAQVFDAKEFYDFLYSFEYLDAKYELRLGGKGLNELSPGEKGLLLLVFYLQLDKDNIPLVIDQPEDNLDNDSIFAVLAKCIRHAKKGRQVILVTHNPNLAVGADAEQVIYVKLEKSLNYKFSCETGAIENPRINGRIVDILEGSQPAFVKRRLMYQIK